ncbi:MAG: DNA polymerase III subunit delta, partial [Oscillospiraceae bacterium]|nr:DNA polymerase III subunit delta [Oscillospiraceae bacterium]
MKLERLAGNAALKRQLSAQAEGRGLSHAYLISGPQGSGKRTLARLMAAAMVCTGACEKPCGACPACKKVLGGIHPDVITIGNDGKDITVGQARTIRSDAYIRPNEGERKGYIIENAQTMNQSAQNAMLKLLEEGPPSAAFLLLTDNPGAMLSTIRSRCEGAALTPVSLREAEIWLAARFPDLPPETVRAAAQRCGGLLGQAVAELEGTRDEGPLLEGARTLLELLTKGDELELAQWCVGLEKWDRDGFSQLMERSVGLLRDALAFQAGVAVSEEAAVRQAAGLSRKQLLQYVDRLEALRAAARFNVGLGHLCGALAAGLSSVG